MYMNKKFIEVSEIIRKAKVFGQTQVSIKKLEKMPAANVSENKTKDELLRELIRCPSCGHEHAYDLDVGCRGYSGEHGYSSHPEIQCFGAKTLKVCDRCGTVYMTQYDLKECFKSSFRGEPSDQTWGPWGKVDL